MTDLSFSLSFLSFHTGPSPPPAPCCGGSTSLATRSPRRACPPSPRRSPSACVRACVRAGIAALTHAAVVFAHRPPINHPLGSLHLRPCCWRRTRSATRARNASPGPWGGARSSRRSSSTRTRSGGACVGVCVHGVVACCGRPPRFPPFFLPFLQAALHLLLLSNSNH